VLLGDLFPKKLKSQIEDWAYDIGACWYIPVPEFQKNKDEKYLIIVSKTTKRVGFVVINTVLNYDVNYSDHSRSLHIKVTPEELPFLDHDSYINCTNIGVVRDVNELERIYCEDSDVYQGRIDENILKRIHASLSMSKIMKPKIAKEFGFDVQI
jgi:hypothetical protein